MIKDVEKKHNIFKKKPKKHIFLVTSWRYTLIGEGSSPIGYEGFVQPRKGGEARLNQIGIDFPRMTSMIFRAFCAVTKFMIIQISPSEMGMGQN